MIAAGIGGGFGPAEPGSVVVADAVVHADLGAQTADGGFSPLSELGWGQVRFGLDRDLAAELAGRARPRLGAVLTVSTVTGTRARAEALLAAHPDALAEAMEGAGVYQAAERAGVPFAELRAISNRVGPRDRDSWQVEAGADRARPGLRPDPGQLASRPGRPRPIPPRRRRMSRQPAPLSLAFSPCPNDTFVFHAWTHGLIPDAPEVRVSFADVDVTNTAAERGEFDVVKVSYAALPWLLPRYRLLPCGGALGRGCGPLVLTRPDRWPGARTDLTGARVAVPGERTTAYLLMRLWAARASRRPASRWSPSPTSCRACGTAGSTPAW